MDINSLITRLRACVSFEEGEYGDMDEVSWQYEKGILISGNEAKLIIEALELMQTVNKSGEILNELDRINKWK
jgi:hypothetical protein